MQNSKHTNLLIELVKDEFTDKQTVKNKTQVQVIFSRVQTPVVWAQGGTCETGIE